MIEGDWFITSAAVVDYLRLCGEDPDDPKAFHAGATRLRELCAQARYLRDYAGGTYESWRVNATIRGRKVRLNLAVCITRRAEGDAPQLVAVEDNDTP